MTLADGNNRESTTGRLTKCELGKMELRALGTFHKEDSPFTPTHSAFHLKSLLNGFPLPTSYPPLDHQH